MLFILAEARAKEPIVPLHLFRNRTYSSSMVSTFFASFAFFGAIIFLPRWFQFVHDFSPTDSGLAALPLMVGLIFSSIVSGLIVSRTGRYKWLRRGPIVVMGVATALMTQLTAGHPGRRSSGSGCSSPASASDRRSRSSRSSSRTPSRSASSASRPRTSRSSARSAARSRSRSSGRSSASTFLEQTAVAARPPPACPRQSSPGSARRLSGALDFNQLTGTGVGFDLGAAILAAAPEAVRAAHRAVHRPNRRRHPPAFSLAVAQTFWIGVAGSVIAVVAAVAIKEIPLRCSNAEPAFGEAPAASPAAVRASTQAAGTAQATRTTPSPTATDGRTTASSSFSIDDPGGTAPGSSSVHG